MFLAYLTNLHGCCRHILIYRNPFYKETTELQRQDGKWTATPDKHRPSFPLVRVASSRQAPSLVTGEHSTIPGRRREGCHRRSSRHCVLSFISSSKGTRMWENKKIMLDPDVEETKRKRGKWHSSTAAAARTLQVDTEEDQEPEASLLPGVANCFQRSPGSQLQANQSPLSARAERATRQGSGETVSLRVPTSGLHQYARGSDTLLFSSMELSALLGGKFSFKPVCCKKARWLIFCRLLL